MYCFIYMQGSMDFLSPPSSVGDVDEDALHFFVGRILETPRDESFQDFEIGLLQSMCHLRGLQIIGF